MKKSNLLFGSIFLLISINTYAQNGCGTGRYLNSVFSNHDLTSNVTYGQNIKVNGQSQTLLLDVYQPQGDDSTILRPLIIWIHAGTFVSGSKTEPDVQPLCVDFAKMGYVAASIEYRLGMQDYPLPGPDSVDATESVVRAVHDARAAVRFFKKNFSENGNTYKIDTNLIFVGGVSAGAIAAVHLAYLDDISEYPSYIDTSKAGLGGGIEGNSGNPGYTSKVRAIINSAGAIRDSSWIKPNDTPIISLHGTADQTVPYGSAMIYVGGFYPIMTVDGSASIHARADNAGFINCLKPFYGANHTPHVENAPYTDTLEKYTANFLYQFICNAAPSCSYQVGISEMHETDSYISIYPNPSSGKFFIELQDAVEFQQANFMLYDVYGRKVLNEKITVSKFQINAEKIPHGLYLYKVNNGNKELGKGRIVVN